MKPSRIDRFVDEYRLDANATQAAIRAGYSAKTAYAQGSRLLKRDDVRQRIAAQAEERAQQTGLSVAIVDELMAGVIEHHKRTGNVTVRDLFDEAGNLRPVHELPEHVAAAIGGLDSEELWEGRGDERERVGTGRKVKLADPAKVAAARVAEVAYKRLGVFNDRDTSRGQFGNLVVEIHDDMPPDVAARFAALARMPRVIEHDDERAPFVPNDVERGYRTDIPLPPPRPRGPVDGGPVDRTPPVYGFGLAPEPPPAPPTSRATAPFPHYEIDAEDDQP